MTIRQRQNIDRRMKKASKMAKFVRKHVNARLGEWMQDRVYDMWDKTY